MRLFLRCAGNSDVHSQHIAVCRRQDVPDEYDVQTTIREKLIPEFQSLLSSKDPLPAYAVRLLGTLLEHWPR